MLVMFRDSWWLESQSGGLCGLLVVELPFFALSMYPCYSWYFSLIFSERIWRLGAPPPKQQLPDHVWKGLLSDPFSFILNGSLSFSNGLVFEGLRRKIGLAMNIFTFISNLSQLCMFFMFCFVLFCVCSVFVLFLFCFCFVFCFCFIIFLNYYSFSRYHCVEYCCPKSRIISYLTSSTISSSIGILIDAT